MNTQPLFRNAFLPLLTGAALLFGTAATAQEIPQTQVPAPVLTAFNAAFPKAMDVEWDLKGTQYNVEFETGLFRNDHEVWYDATGKQIRHEEEVAGSDLPEAVKATIAKEFAGFSTDDVKRIEADGATTYIVELQNGPTEWKVAYDAAGKQLQKQAD